MSNRVSIFPTKSRAHFSGYSCQIQGVWNEHIYYYTSPVGWLKYTTLIDNCWLLLRLSKKWLPDSSAFSDLRRSCFLNNKQFLRIWSNVLRTFVIPITIWCSVQFKWFYSRIINAEDIYVTEGWDFEWRIVIRVALSYVLSQWFPMSIWTKIMKMRRNEHFWPYLKGIIRWFSIDVTTRSPSFLPQILQKLGNYADFN